MTKSKTKTKKTIPDTAPVKETIGKIVLDLQKSDMQTDAIELQREIHKGSNSEKSYEEEVWETVALGCKDSLMKGDFFVVVLFKKERLLLNTVRQYFFYRQTCPTPEFDQTVYKYTRKDGKMDFIWCIPNNAACQFLPQMLDDVPPDQQTLIHMVNAFRCGDLDKLALKLNKEILFTKHL